MVCCHVQVAEARTTSKCVWQMLLHQQSRWYPQKQHRGVWRSLRLLRLRCLRRHRRSPIHTPLGVGSCGFRSAIRSCFHFHCGSTQGHSHSHSHGYFDFDCDFDSDFDFDCVCGCGYDCEEVPSTTTPCVAHGPPQAHAGANEMLAFSSCRGRSAECGQICKVTMVARVITTTIPLTLAERGKCIVHWNVVWCCPDFIQRYIHAWVANFTCRYPGITHCTSSPITSFQMLRCRL